MDDSSEVETKKAYRRILELRVERELLKLSQEVTLETIARFGAGTVYVPEVEQLASKIVRIVKEYSV